MARVTGTAPGDAKGGIQAPDNAGEGQGGDAGPMYVL